MADRKITSIEQTESFEGILVNDSGNPRQATNENVRKVLGISGAETAIDKLNTDLASAVSEIQKNTEADAETKRKLDFLWKLNQGISYQYETDSASAYKKDIPGGAKCATVNKVGGKTVVWNQIEKTRLQHWDTSTSTKTVNDDGTVTVTSDGTLPNNAGLRLNGNTTKNGHVYLIRFNVKGNWSTNLKLSTYITKITKIYSAELSTLSEDTYQKNAVIFKVESGAETGTGIRIGDNGTYLSGNMTIKDFIFVDLTQMFGSGNEPSTVAEFEAMFPAEYYEYDAGTLMSAPVNEVVEQGKNLFILSQKNNNGITFGVKDSKYVLSGTSTALATNRGEVTHLESGNYTLSGIVISSDQGIYLRVRDSSLSLVASITFDGATSKSLNFTISKDGDYYIEINVASGITLNDYTVMAQLEKSSSATPYSPYHKTAYPIPQAITQLDGYGWGITDEVRNYVDWENKTYHQMVGSVDLGTLDYNYWGDGVFIIIQGIPNIKKASADTASDGAVGICSKYAVSGSYNSYYGKNGYIATGKSYTIITDTSYEDYALIKKTLSGVMLYYELAEEVVTDISGIIGDTFQNPFEVEAGGTLTFKNQNGDGFRIPVPNEEEYLISLAEVTA